MAQLWVKLVRTMVDPMVASMVDLKGPLLVESKVVLMVVKMVASLDEP